LEAVRAATSRKFGKFSPVAAIRRIAGICGLLYRGYHTCMFKRPVFSSKLAAACVFAASYLPPLVGFVYGVGHCDTCRQAWIKLVWIVQGALIPFLLTNFLRLPRVDETWGLILAIAIQLAWLASWTWLASRSKIALGAVIAVVLGASVWATYILAALLHW
jgi:hypothetical protein